MRTSITQDQQGYVTLCYDDPLLTARVTMTFFCPPDGGYVRIWRADGNHLQICNRLDVRGDTLISPSRDALLSVIRREYRAMKREHAKWYAYE